MGERAGCVSGSVAADGLLRATGSEGSEGETAENSRDEGKSTFRGLEFAGVSVLSVVSASASVLSDLYRFRADTADGWCATAWAPGLFGLGRSALDTSSLSSPFGVHWLNGESGSAKGRDNWWSEG